MFDFQWLVQTLGGFAIIIGGLVLAWKIARPHIAAELKKDIKEEITANMMCKHHNQQFESLYEQLRDLNTKKEKDFNSIKKLLESDKTLMKALYAVLEHLNTGNATGKMKESLGVLINAIIDS